MEYYLLPTTESELDWEEQWYLHYHDLVMSKYDGYIREGLLTDDAFQYYGAFHNEADLEAGVEAHLTSLRPVEIKCEGSCINDPSYPHYIFSLCCS